MARRFCSLAALTVAGWVVLANAAFTVEPSSPDQVRNALRVLAYVQNDMASKLPTHNYARLPHENEEFQEAAPALRAAVSKDAPELRSEVDKRLTRAQQDAKQVATVSSSGDEARIGAAVKAVADDLQSLYEIFPAELRPVPGQLGPGPGRTGGPPPALR